MHVILIQSLHVNFLIRSFSQQNALSCQITIDPSAYQTRAERAELAVSQHGADERTFMDGSRATLYLQVPHSLRSSRPATKAIVLCRHCRKHKHQTQTPTLMWQKQKGSERQRRGGKTKIGPEAIKKPNFRVC